SSPGNQLLGTRYGMLFDSPVDKISYALQFFGIHTDALGLGIAQSEAPLRLQTIPNFKLRRKGHWKFSLRPHSAKYNLRGHILRKRRFLISRNDRMCLSHGIKLGKAVNIPKNTDHSRHFPYQFLYKEVDLRADPQILSARLEPQIMDTNNDLVVPFKFL